jgi:hypothetical protein
MPPRHDRRRFLKHSLLASAGAAAVSFEEANLAAAYGAHEDESPGGSSEPRIEYATLDDLKGKVPVAEIGKMRLSRLILGGNLMGGWAHARDLVYVSDLVKAYHTEKKIFETLHLAEECGVNTLLTNPILCDIIEKYWRNGGKIQFISDCGGGDVLSGIKKSVDHGAAACYIHGAVGDRLAEQGNWDLMAKALELIRSNGVPAGIGGHRLETVSGSVAHGLKPDFWMKTLHRSDYWSFRHPEEKGNKYCDDADAVIAYMQTLEEPWIAFKTLAAGALHPKVAFRWCFESGADFICVGMYDFQLVEDANLAHDILSGSVSRKRPWRA